MKITPRRNFYEFVNQYAIVAFDELSIASIIRARTSQKGVESLLWITEYITKDLNSAIVQAINSKRSSTKLTSVIRKRTLPTIVLRSKLFLAAFSLLTYSFLF